MAGKIKKLRFAEGITVSTPTGLEVEIARLGQYVDDAAYEAAVSAAVDGSIYINTTSNFIRYYNGSAWIDLTDVSSAQTLTNKSIDADTNTITNIDNDDIKASAGIDATKIGAGDVDNTELSTLNGVTSGIQSQIDSKEDAANKGAASGYCPLDASSKVPTGNLPDSVLGTLQYQSGWNADTNTPTLTSSVGTQGHYYVVTTAGSTSLDGENDWVSGDWAVFNGSVWEKIDNSDKVSSVASKTGAVTLDLSDVDNGGSLVSPSISESIDLTEQGSTPATPAIGRKKLYAKTDNKLYTLDDSGFEQEVGSGSSGGSGTGDINYISNPSASVDLTGWTESLNGAVDVSRTAVAAELPRELSTGTGLKIVGTAAATGEYVKADVDIDDVDENYMLRAKFAWKPDASYTSADFKAVIHDGTNPVKEVDLPAYEKVVEFGWMADKGLNYEFRIVSNVATSTGGVISNVIVGPGSVVSGAMVGDWESFTPGSVAGLPTSSSVGRYRRVGDSIDVELTYTVSGAATSQISLSESSVLPSGLTFSGLPATGRALSGSWYAYDVSAASTVDDFIGGLWITSNGGVIPVGDDGTDRLDNGKPFGAAWASGDIFSIRFTSESIAEWSGSGTVNLGANDVEYAYNSSTATASSDTSSFGYGPSGAQFVNISTTGILPISKRVRFQTPIQETDVLDLQVKTEGSSGWRSIGGSFLNYQRNDAGTITTGMDVINVNTTDVDVRFFSSPAPNVLWSSIDASDSFRWRVVKHRSGIPTGFGLATSEHSGLVKKNKWQQKFYTGTATSAATLITMNGLEVGKSYKYHVQMYSSSGSSRVDIKENGNLVSRVSAEASAMNGSQTGIFTATGTTATMEWNTGSVNGDGAAGRTWMILEEFANGELTTDFT